MRKVLQKQLIFSLISFFQPISDYVSCIIGMYRFGCLIDYIFDAIFIKFPPLILYVKRIKLIKHRGQFFLTI